MRLKLSTVISLCTLTIALLLSSDTTTSSHIDRTATTKNSIYGWLMPGFQKVAANTSEFNCLVSVIHHEAGNQSDMGKEAVGIVVMNRVLSQDYPKTVCGVTAQNTEVNGKKICQFSYYCTFGNRILHNEAWGDSIRVASKLIKFDINPDLVILLEQSTHFHATYVKPQWSKKLRKLLQIEDHIFYSTI